MRATFDIKTAYNAMDDVKIIMRENSVKVAKQVQKAKDDFIMDGIKAGYNVTKYLSTIIPKKVKESLADDILKSNEMNLVFNQLWQEASDSLKYTVNGVELSNRIWDMDNTSLQQMRDFMSRAMIEGRTQAEIYSFYKDFLLLPDVDMRKNVWKEFFDKNPPGRGVYKSAWKNVLRFMQTETNRAYRQAFASYADGRDWISSLRWNRVLGGDPCEICDGFADDDSYGLGPGLFPADEFPDSGHPHCLCFGTYEIDTDSLSEDQSNTEEENTDAEESD